jgi:hypothetical protein
MVPGVVAAAAAPSVDTEHAVNAANRRAYAQSNRAANDCAHRTCRASALADTFPAALLTAAENALSVGSVRDGK